MSCCCNSLSSVYCWVIFSTVAENETGAMISFLWLQKQWSVGRSWWQAEYLLSVTATSGVCAAGVHIVGIDDCDIRRLKIIAQKSIVTPGGRRIVQKQRRVLWWHCRPFLQTFPTVIPFSGIFSGKCICSPAEPGLIKDKLKRQCQAVIKQVPTNRADECNEEQHLPDQNLLFPSVSGVNADPRSLFFSLAFETVRFCFWTRAC